MGPALTAVSLWISMLSVVAHNFTLTFVPSVTGPHNESYGGKKNSQGRKESGEYILVVLRALTHAYALAILG